MSERKQYINCFFCKHAVETTTGEEMRKHTKHTLTNVAVKNPRVCEVCTKLIKEIVKP